MKAGCSGTTTCNSSTQEAETGQSRVEDSLGYLARPCLKREEEEEEEERERERERNIIMKRIILYN
jgi:hypothetical protein